MTFATMEQLIAATRSYVEAYMGQYDASHDSTHILRVLHNAHTIAAGERSLDITLDLDESLITLSALLHDVGDHKYVKAGEDGTTMAEKFLLSQNASPELAEKVQLICTNVSYTNETAHMKDVKILCDNIPELRIVQDADRLDSIGASGIARLFAYGGAKAQERGLNVSHFEVKLLHIVKRMKTKTGLGMAEKRTERLNTFLAWWKDETEGVEGLAEEMARKTLEK